MKINNKVLRIFGAMTLLFILAAACGPAPQTAVPPTEVPATTVPSTEVPATTVPTEVTEIDVMHYYGEGVADQPMMVEWGKQFEALNPQYKIKWTWGGSEVGTLFNARMNANDPPDLSISNDGHVASYARDGIIEPLDQYLDGQSYEGDAVWKDTFYPGLLENGHITDGQMGDHYYGIPDNMHFGGIFYNKGIFEANGYQIPTTWDELIALCDTIQTDLNLPCFGADNFPDYNATPLYFIMWRTVGAQKTYDAGMGTISFDSDPGFLRAATLFQELYTTYTTPGWTGNQWPAGQVDFANGGAAMIFMPTWLPSELANVKAEDFTMGMFAVPSIAGGYTGSPDLEVKFNGWFLPKGSRHPDAAMAFAKFVTSYAYQKARSDRISLISVLSAVPLPADLADMKTALETSNKVRFAAGLDADAYDWQTVVEFPLSDQLAMGTITPEEYIAQLVEQTQAYYATH
jgi:raffinose/stachyose/melibiose transport system substrate-binding protein